MGLNQDPPCATYAACVVRGPCHTARLPEMSCTNTATTASTSSRWMNPPSVYELTTPNSHSSNNTTKSVHSMCHSHIGRTLTRREEQRGGTADHAVRTSR